MARSTRGSSRSRRPHLRQLHRHGGGSGCADPAADSIAGAAAVAVSPDGTSVYVLSPSTDTVTHFARASDGSLSFESCISESGAVPGCADPPTDSLDGASGIAVSPSGNSVYVASSDDAAVTNFTRAPSGSLTFQECFANGGGSGCTDPPNDVLALALDVAVSPEGTSVYVTSNFQDSIARFDRATNGNLTPAGCIADGGAAGCADPPLDSLDGATGVEVSPDGSSVYVASLFDRALTHFSRAGSGALTYGGCIADSGMSGCADPPIDPLFSARNVTVSPDGSSVYVVNTSGDGALVHFVRAPASGSPAFNTCISNFGFFGCVDPPMDTFTAAFGVDVSPDGASIYVASNFSDAINHFNRAANGTPTLANCIRDEPSSDCGGSGIPSLDGAQAVAISPDGTSVYVTSTVANAITHLVREQPAAPPTTPEPPPADGGDTAAPDTTITSGPKDKTKKKTATFEFTANEPGASFECSLDGSPFASCASPDTFKVKKGEHTFSVRAKDPAGNIDGSPATDDWKVKKKKKKKK